MIQSRTILKVADNSGAKTVRCIKVLGGFKRKIAKIGDTIIVSVQELRNKARETSKVKKKEVYKALVIRTRKKVTKKNGVGIQFNDNIVILLNKQENLLGTRVLGPLPRSLKKKKNQKLISLSPGLI